MAAIPLATLQMGVHDVEECWALDQLCFEGGETYDRETFRDLLTHRNAIGLKVVCNGAGMVGFTVGVVESDGTGHVVVLGVSPEWRRQGIGRALMGELEMSFLNRAVTMMHLEVRTTNDAARALYQQLGFTIAGRRLAYYTNGDDGFLMVKRL